ncbi:MAG: hypothetical protein KGI71_03980 [Patescibacteria group bacterium]|nr:hypothetical protein [Patescibacteria group bacterium]
MNALFFALHLLAYFCAWLGIVFVLVWLWSRWQNAQKALDDAGGANTAEGGQRVHHGLAVDMFEADPIRADQDAAWSWIDGLLSGVRLPLLYLALGLAILASIAFAGGFFN